MRGEGKENWADYNRPRPGCQGPHLMEKAVDFSNVPKHYYELA
jgi:hypothetical protein